MHGVHACARATSARVHGRTRHGRGWEFRRNVLQGALAALYRAARLGRLCQTAEDELGLLLVLCEVRLCLWEGMYIWGLPRVGRDHDSSQHGSGSEEVDTTRSRAERRISAAYASVDASVSVSVSASPRTCSSSTDAASGRPGRDAPTPSAPLALSPSMIPYPTHHR